MWSLPGKIKEAGTILNKIILVYSYINQNSMVMAKRMGRQINGTENKNKNT